MELAGFKTIKELGSGGFGSVFLVKATKSTKWCTRGQEFAAKRMVDSSTCSTTSVAKMARREYAMMRAAASPFVLRAHCFVRRATHYHFIMELGVASLASVLFTREALMVEEVKTVARSVLLALDHVHGLNIVHRDVKPDNIVLVADGGHLVAKLADFGLAAKLKGDALSKDFPGSSYYMAPEVAERLPHDAKADVYSLGVSIVELLHPEFGPRPTEHGPNPVEDPLISRMATACLRKSPKDRPSAATLLKDPSFFYFFHPARLPVKSLEAQPDLLAVEKAELAMIGAARRWRLTNIEHMEGVESDGPRKLLIDFLEVLLFVKAAPEDVRVLAVEEGGVEFECSAFESRLARLLDTDGSMSLVFPVGRNTSLGVQLVDRFVEPMVMDVEAEPGVADEEADAEPEVDMEEADVEPEEEAADNVEHVEERVGAEPIVPEEEVADNVEAPSKCDCDRPEELYRLTLCQLCVEKAHPGWITNVSEPFAQLTPFLLCEKCTVVHVRQGHAVRDAHGVQLEKREEAVAVEIAADKMAIDAHLGKLKRQLDRDEEYRRTTDSTVAKRILLEDGVAAKEAIAKITKRYKEELLKVTL